MNHIFSRLFIAVHGYFMFLSFEVFGADSSNRIGVEDFVFYSSGLGFNLTEQLQSSSFLTSSEKMSCNKSIEPDVCMGILQGNFSSYQETSDVLNASRICHQQKYTFGCARHLIVEDPSLIKWSHSVQKSMESLCSNKCWQKKGYMLGLTCNLTTDRSKNKFVTKKQVNFVTEVLTRLCSKPAKRNELCSDAIDKYLTKTTSQTKYCNVKPKSQCTSECKEEVSAVGDTIECCMFSLAAVLQKNNVTKTPVQEMIKTCQLGQEKCKIIPTVSSSTQPAANQEGDTNRVSGRLVAGICISLIIGGFGLSLMIRCLYRTLKRRKGAKYEDYGYSQLRMMEESLYDDIEESDDDLLEI